MPVGDRVAEYIANYGGLFLKLEEILVTLFQEVLSPYDLSKLLKNKPLSLLIDIKNFFRHDIDKDYTLAFEYYGESGQSIYSFTISLENKVIISCNVMKDGGGYLFKILNYSEEVIREEEKRKLIILSILSIRKVLYEQ